MLRELLQREGPQPQLQPTTQTLESPSWCSAADAATDQVLCFILMTVVRYNANILFRHQFLSLRMIKLYLTVGMYALLNSIGYDTIPLVISTIRISYSYVLLDHDL